MDIGKGRHIDKNKVYRTSRKKNNENLKEINTYIIEKTNEKGKKPNGELKIGKNVCVNTI